MANQEKGRGRFGNTLKVRTSFEGRQTVSLAEIMFRNLDKKKFKKDYLAGKYHSPVGRKPLRKSPGHE